MEKVFLGSTPSTMMVLKKSDFEIAGRKNPTVSGREASPLTVSTPWM